MTRIEEKLELARIRRDTFRLARDMGNPYPDAVRAAQVTTERAQDNPTTRRLIRDELRIMERELVEVSS